MTSTIGHLRLVEDVFKRWIEEASAGRAIPPYELRAIKERISQVLEEEGQKLVKETREGAK